MSDARTSQAALKKSTPDEAAYLQSVLKDPCAYCGETGQAIDHIDPLIRDGEDSWANITSVCRSCNSGKRGSTLLGFLMVHAYDDLWGIEKAIFTLRQRVREFDRRDSRHVPLNAKALELLRPPRQLTYYELAKVLDISHPKAKDIFRQLEEDGYAEQTPAHDRRGSVAYRARISSADPGNP